MRLAVPGPCAMTSSQIFSRRDPFNSVMSAFTFLKLAMQFSMGGRVVKGKMLHVQYPPLIVQVKRVTLH